ncbi:efflux transporter outer membrane subunit [Rhodanobacter hydrolyticus]|uniref:Efflux transporter outer membrane subunit n=1 Tax=Rhodanobacter hydrolyticus TaxID=2250595 RepID=A0ABW8J926_9GAMM
MTRVTRTLASAVLALLLAACASTRGLHPNGHEIVPGSLQAQQSLAGAQLSPAAWPQQDWWHALGDTQLDALVAEALRDNPGLAAADARAQLAQSEAQALDAARDPSVEASYAATGARLSEKEVGLVLPEAVGTFAWMQSAGVDFSWNLDLWGGQRAAWEAALGRSRAAEVDRRAARIQLSANVTLAYIQLRQAFALRDIAQHDVERSDRIAALTHTLVASGMGLPDSLLQARAEAGIAHQHLAAADAAIDSARISLAVLLGKGPDRGLQIAAPTGLKPVSLAIPPDLTANLLGRRPDLVAARWRVEAASQDIKAAKAQFMPNLNISAMAGFLALGDNVPLFQMPARTYSVGPALSLPLFDGKRLRAGLNARDALYDGAVANYNQTLVRAVNQVADLLSLSRSVQNQLQTQQDVLHNAQRAYDDAQIGYKAGLGTELNTLVARHLLLTAEQNQAVLQSRQAELAVRMVEALGGGFENEAAQAK